MGEFFGFGGYTRPAEGYMSWQHLTFVTSLVVVMIGFAIFFGIKNRKKDDKVKNKVLIFVAILINVIEISRIIIACIKNQDPMRWMHYLPLYLCSIQFIAIPLAAFSKGRLKEAALDFVFIFGLLGAILGTYGAGNDYSCYPILSFDIITSGLTHCLSGFTSLYIVISGMASMKKRNIFITFAILISFCFAAYIVNLIFDFNYMFLMRGDGTPYDIVFGWVGGSPILYPVLVVLLFIIYVSIFYASYFLFSNKKRKQK